VPELALAAALARRLVDLANSSAGSLFWLTYGKDDGTRTMRADAREPHERLAVAAPR
jgi:hypothetical protein